MNNLQELLTMDLNNIDFLSQTKPISEYQNNQHTIILGEPGSGKTTLAGTFPGKTLFIECGNDGGGSVLMNNPNVVQLPVRIDNVIDKNTGAVKYNAQQILLKILNDLLLKARNNELEFDNIIIDPLTTIQEKLETYFKILVKRNLQFDEWNAISTMMISIFDKLDELSLYVRVNSICHIQPRELTDNTTGDVYAKILPQMTEKLAKRLLKNASYVWYVTPKQVTDDLGNKSIKRVTIIGGHGMLPTKSRGIYADGLEFENFNYDKFKALLNKNNKPATPQVNEDELILEPKQETTSLEDLTQETQLNDNFLVQDDDFIKEQSESINEVELPKMTEIIKSTSAEDWKGYKVQSLKEQLQLRGIEPIGKKEELINKLVSYDNPQTTNDNGLFETPVETNVEPQFEAQPLQGQVVSDDDLFI